MSHAQKSTRSKNGCGLLLTRVVFNMRRTNQKACSPLHHKPLEDFFQKMCSLWAASQPASKLLFQDALGALGTNATCTALLQLGTRHCEKCRGTKHIWSLSHSWSFANMLAADNTRFVFRQLSHSHNPTKLTPFSLDRRMCHLSYQGQSIVLSLGRASPGCCSSWHGEDIASGSNPQSLL